MKLLFLYPRAWRKRYGDEFEALLEDAPLNWRGLPDILAAALKEHFQMQSFTRLVAWLAGAGLAAGFGCSFAVAPQYRAHSTVELRGADSASILREARVVALSRFSLAALINDPRLSLYPDEQRHEPLEEVEDDMRHDLRMTVIPSTQPNAARVSVEFTYGDPKLSQETVESAIEILHQHIAATSRDAQLEISRFDDGYVNELNRLETRISALEARIGVVPPAQDNRSHRAAASPYELTRVERAELPTRPVSPDRAAWAASGFGTGAATALLIALFRRRSYPVTI